MGQARTNNLDFNRNQEIINNPDFPCGESIEIDGSVFGCYSVVNDSLVIDQSIADGFAITLKR
jgi:hypothetical protein